VNSGKDRYLSEMLKRVTNDGLTIPPPKLDEFIEYIRQMVNDEICPGTLNKEQLTSCLSMFRPYGAAMLAPLFGYEALRFRGPWTEGFPLLTHVAAHLVEEDSPGSFNDFNRLLSGSLDATYRQWAKEYFTTAKPLRYKYLLARTLGLLSYPPDEEWLNKNPLVIHWARDKFMSLPTEEFATEPMLADEAQVLITRFEMNMKQKYPNG
jgi:hypothetical protein